MIPEFFVEGVAEGLGVAVLKAGEEVVKGCVVVAEGAPGGVGGEVEEGFDGEVEGKGTFGSFGKEGRDFVKVIEEGYII